jgi:two-component system, OmpR family, sensor kinase
VPFRAKGKTVLNSVRVRITAWYTAIMALVLVLLSLFTYTIFWKNTVQQTDAELSELAGAFLVTFQDELQDISHREPQPTEDLSALRAAARQAMLEHHFRDHLFAVVDSSGNVVINSEDVSLGVSPRGDSSTGAVSRDSFAHDGSTASLLSSRSFRSLIVSASKGQAFQTVQNDRRKYRGYARPMLAAGRPYTLALLRSLHPQQEMLEDVRASFAWVVPIALLLASAGGYFLARKSLASVVAMSTQAEKIGAANLHDRLIVRNEKDELGHLARSFNELLERLEQSFERQRRFVADASHELRTPVAILRGEAEVALSQPVRPSAEYRESLTVLHQESQRLTRIVEDLFTLTRADAGQYPLTPRHFYLDELVADCIHSARTLASAKQISLKAAAEEELSLFADESLVRRMILNLLDNAIKYTPRGGSVSIRCSKCDGSYALQITDSGPGIPKDMQARIFERFVRADEARSRGENDGGGAGLGLSIARWIAEVHGGRLELTRSDEAGSTFTAILPARSSNEPANNSNKEDKPLSR